MCRDRVVDVLVGNVNRCCVANRGTRDQRGHALATVKSKRQSQREMRRLEGKGKQVGGQRRLCMSRHRMYRE